MSLAIALLILSNKSATLTARLYAYLSTLIGCWSWFYFLWLRTTQDAILADFFVRTCMAFVVLMPPTFLHLVSTMTDTLKQRTLHVSSYLLSILICLTVYTPAFSPGVARHLVFPFWPLPGPTFLLHLFHITLSVACGLSLLGCCASRSSGRVRSQLWWAFWAFAIGWFAGLINYLMWFRSPFPPVLNLFVAAYVIAIAYAIIKHQLLDLRVVIRRSLVYSILIACITASYLVMVLIMEHWFQGFFGYRSFIATVVVAFLIAIFFNPLRHQIQTFVDRALFAATPVELAAQREQLLAEVRKGDQMKAVGTLAAGLAHEIKNPIASIKTFTEYLEQRHDDPAFRAKFQRIVGGELERINLIVQQLLEFAKPVPPKFASIDLCRLMDETLEFLSSDLTQHRVDVQRGYDAQPHVLGDARQLKQVFLNLLLNSLQAMNGHGKLAIHTEVRGSNMILRITDNGTGIAAGDLPHIFEPFFSTKPTGTGLGLSVVRGIIEEHRGSITIESQLGLGTTVSISLPPRSSNA